MRFLCLALLLLGPFLSMAQTASIPPVLCGNDLFSDLLRTHYPDLQTNVDATFATARQHTGVSQRSPLTIRVVVHVVWKDEAENLPDSIIENQIQVLNADYNRWNADTAQLRALFQPVAGNPDIQFQLADVIRVQTDQDFKVNLFGTNLLTEVKHDADGGSTAWNTQQYLNIWICKIQPITLGSIELAQILGFAFPPADLANWPGGSSSPNADEDGVVVDYRMVGSNNPYTIAIPGGTGNIEVRGRTLVHEVGHYLGLRHIWGDGGLLGPNDCAQSDGVDDTPFANAQSSFDCDQSRNTCDQVEDFYNADTPDLIENYMDYSSESCMNMFSKGQINIMRNVLQGPRAGLIASTGVANVNASVQLDIYPNPALERSTVDFVLPENSAVTLLMTGPDGRIVRQLTHDALAAGRHKLVLDLKGLANGIYFVQLRMGTSVALRRLTIAR